MWIVILILFVVLLLLFLIAPSPTHRAEPWRGTRFAHRGLYDENAAENTLEAFEKACRLGVGIELDVQFSSDGTVMVFHDDDLKRMTGDARRVDHVSRAELQTLTLNAPGRIPTFEETLARVGGRVPLLVELKNGPQNDKLCAETLALLRSYSGKYIVESFNPLIMRWFKKNAPDLIRGQLVGAKASYLASNMGLPGALILSCLSLNFLSRPDFVAYDVNAAGYRAPKIQRALFHTPLAAWTVRDEKTYRDCLARGEMPIFEGFVPKEDEK